MAGRVSCFGPSRRASSCFGFIDDGIVVWMPWGYIVRCSDGTLYVGHTCNVHSREKTHNEGHGDLLDAAIARERQLKRWTTAKKEALIAGDLATLKSRSVRRRK
jgi:putative endonuclease